MNSLNVYKPSMSILYASRKIPTLAVTVLPRYWNERHQKHIRLKKVTITKWSKRKLVLPFRYAHIYVYQAFEFVYARTSKSRAFVTQGRPVCPISGKDTSSAVLVMPCIIAHGHLYSCKVLINKYHHTICLYFYCCICVSANAQGHNVSDIHKGT